MMAEREDELALGASVVIVGTVVGRSEFQSGPPSYLVEFDKKGRTNREWFLGADLEADTDQDGGGI